MGSGRFPPWLRGKVGIRIVCKIVCFISTVKGKSIHIFLSKESGERDWEIFKFGNWHSKTHQKCNGPYSSYPLVSNLKG